MKPVGIVDLGEWSEDKFSGFCSRAGVTRNKSVQDRTGWDYLIEFPPAATADVPADLKPVEVSARVQVKSKRSGKPTVSLKLSNALRFSKDPLPCFVVLFLATKGCEPVRVFARHIWEEEIERALKRAREAHADGRDDLNKLAIVFSFGTKDDHSADLMAWMASTIAAYRDHYAETKATLVRTLGFEEGSIHGTLKFNVEDREALVDHLIGLTPAAPALGITVKERRFGIDAAAPIFEGTPDFVHMQSHPQPCRVRVRGEVGEDVWFDGKLFLPGLPNLPRELFKLRVVAEFIEIVLGISNGGTVVFNLDRSIHRSLSELRALASVLESAKVGPLQIQISKNSNALSPFVVNMHEEKIGDDLQQLSNVIACLEKASAGLLPSDLTLSLADISEAWNEIVAFNGMISGTNFRAKFTLDREFPSDVGPVTSIFFYDFVDIGGWTFMAVVRRPILRFEISGTGGSLQCGDTRVVEAIVRRGKGDDHIAEIRKLYMQANKAEGRGVLELFGGCFRAALAWIETKK